MEVCVLYITAWEEQLKDPIPELLNVHDENMELERSIRAHTTNWKVLADDTWLILPVGFGQFTLPLIKGTKQ